MGNGKTTGMGCTSSIGHARERRLAHWLVAFVLLWACVPPLAAQDWTYRIRPGDTLWDLSGEYLKPGIPWQKLQSHNQISNPYQLPPGSTIRFPLAWLYTQPAKARVLAVQGQATVSSATSDSPAAVTQDMQLGIGTLLRTGKDSSLSLEFADGSRLLLQADSELRLDHMSRYGKSGMVDTRLRLQRGRISNTIKPTAGASPAFIVDTPNASSAVRGTKFRMDAGTDNTKTEVVDGNVAVNAGNHTTLVRKGYGTRVAAGQTAPIRAVLLLPPPDLSGMPPRINGARARLQWPAVEGSRRYRVELSSSEQFETLLADIESTEADTTLPVLADGHYFLRVRAIDAQGLEGHDASASFAVEVLPEPPFAIAPAHDSIVRDPEPEFRWAAAADAAAYRLEFADNPAFERATAMRVDAGTNTTRAAQSFAPGQYYWRIASDAANGRQGPFSDPLAFTLRPLVEAGEIGHETSDTREVTFRWRAGAPGQSYRFQLSRTRDFARLRVDQRVDEPQITLPRLPAGTWYLRAQAIDSDGHEAPFPPAQSVQVPCRTCQALVGAGALLILLAL